MQSADISNEISFTPDEIDAIQRYVARGRVFSDAISSFRKALEDDYRKRSVTPRTSRALVQERLLMVLRTIAPMYPVADAAMQWDQYFSKSNRNRRARLDVMADGLDTLSDWFRSIRSEGDGDLLACQARAFAVLLSVLTALVPEDVHEPRISTPILP